LNYSDVHAGRRTRNALKRLYTALDAVAAGDGGTIDWARAARRRNFKAAMDDDFGTPEAVAVLFELAARSTERRSRRMPQGCSRRWAAVLGLLQQAIRRPTCRAAASLD
jgi:cysteinyl-tRNA synthetase